jgi:DNA modification methylase
MPESVTDRPTKAHEYVFLLTKSPRYYFDQEAVREDQDPSSLERLKRGWNGNGDRGYPNGPQNHMKNYMGKTEEEVNALPGRNIRTVWTIATQPTKEAHFATYPEKLVEPCILAGTSARGCCPKCGAGWERVSETTYVASNDGGGMGTYRDDTRAYRGCAERKRRIDTTTGWQPTCSCDAGDPAPCLVLDPFSGSGTTGRVAIKNGRRYVGLELNWKYIDEISRKRIQVQMGTGL